MRVHLSICSLLVCITFGLLTGADPIRTRRAENIIENDVDGETLEMHQSNEILRLAKEYQAFPRGLMVENDHGDLVELNLDEGAEDAESEEETKTNIDKRVLFYLSTRKNPTKYQQLWLDDKETLASSNFNANRPTHFVTHGWINSAHSPACTLIRDAYLKNDDLNIIVVDWSKITLKGYVFATRRVMMVGRYVAKMINFLESHARLNTDKTTLVGHSLGAHVMGLAGYNAKGTINTVIGLDPALPLFVFAGPKSRISVEDANHVQIIHTNAGLLGYLAAIGHSDFYPNGGSRQHGCFLDPGGACSHARSYRFFAESINSNRGFYGKACNSFSEYILGRCKPNLEAVMGGRIIDFENGGKYFLSTRSWSPYAKGP